MRTTCEFCGMDDFASLMDYEVMEIKQEFNHKFFCSFEHLVEYYSKQFTKD